MEKEKATPKKPPRAVLKISDSSITMRQMVMPQHANPYNTVFGGVIMSWIDMAAAMVAERHTRSEVVTVFIGEISFKAKIKVGDHILVKAAINYVGKTSMIIGVKVEAENPHTGIKQHATTAYLTFVSLDEKGRPQIIPDIQPVSEDEKRRYQEAKTKMAKRKK